jgi:DNA repair protein RecO (recombination protein O)
MLITTLGVVLKTRNIGENDRIITILSKDLGVIEATANNVKRVKSGLASSSQVLGYSEFALFYSKDKYSINSAHSINCFYNIRLDVTKLSLALYFCELITFLKIHNDTSKEMLRLILNTLYFIEKGEKNDCLLKAIFEFKSLSVAGFMPNLIGCKNCLKYNGDKFFFNILDGDLICGDCNSNTMNIYELTNSVLTAMRHIIYSEIDNLFNFSISDNSIKSLCFITENYAIAHIERNFKALDFYKSMLGGQSCVT